MLDLGLVNTPHPPRRIGEFHDDRYERYSVADTTDHVCNPEFREFLGE